MSVKHKCKITVVKRLLFPEVSMESYGHPGQACNFYYDGQEFMVDKDNFATMLDGEFCGEARGLRETLCAYRTSG